MYKEVVDPIADRVEEFHSDEAQVFVEKLDTARKEVERSGGAKRDSDLKWLHRVMVESLAESHGGAKWTS